MNRHIKVIPIVGLSLVVMVGALPATALANPLLSGYGGPGQGSQAILGSALVNGPRGGGGGAGGANGSSSASPGSGAGANGAVAAPRGSGRSNGSAAGDRSPASRRAATGAGGNGKDGQASVGALGMYPVSERDGAGRSPGALGFSADDLLYMIFALGALAFAGVFTRRLAHTTAAARRR
jgi:hypothetical protein